MEALKEDPTNAGNVAYEAGVTPEFALYVKGLIDDVKPKKVSHAQGYFKADFSGQYNLRTLDRMVNEAFENYALDQDFLRLAEQKRKSFAPGVYENEITTALSELKRIYFDSVVKYYMTEDDLFKAHLTPLTRILSTSYDADEFLRRIHSLRKNLEEIGQTTLPRDEGKRIPAYDESERVKAERVMTFKQLFDADAEKNRLKREKEKELKQRRAELERKITEINPFNHNSRIYVGELPDVQTLLANPESAEYIPKVMLSMSDYIDGAVLPETGEMIRNNLRTIFRNPQSQKYQQFISQFNELISDDNIQLKTIISKGASIRKDKVLDFDVTEMTHTVAPWIATYYRLNGQSGAAISDLRKKHVNSLVELIIGTYVEMLQSDERIAV